MICVERILYKSHIAKNFAGTRLLLKCKKRIDANDASAQEDDLNCVFRCHLADVQKRHDPRTRRRSTNSTKSSSKQFAQLHWQTIRETGSHNPHVSRLTSMNTTLWDKCSSFSANNTLRCIN